MKNNKIFAVDVDDVCLDLNTIWLEEYNQVYNDDLKTEEITEWAIHKFVKPECGTKIYDLLSYYMYTRIQPVEGAISGIRFLRKQGYRVIFVTSNGIKSTNGSAKYSALNRLGFKVELKDYIEASDKSLIMCNFLLDDAEHNIDSCQGKGIIFTKPWNIKRGTIFNGFRVNNWKDLVNKVKKGIIK